MNFDEYFASIVEDVYRNYELVDPGHGDPDHIVKPAVRALERANIGAVDAAACLEWACTSPTLPEQSWTFDFGEPSLTVAGNDLLRVDLLFWTNNDSNLHDHKTCGAFGALRGDRVHSEYTFRQDKVWDDALLSGPVERQSTEIMRTGDVRPIRAELIHDLFWIDKPSVTIVVRCNDHPTPHTPLEYWANPGLAYRPLPQQNTPLSKRRSQSLALLAKASPVRYRHALEVVLRTGRPSEVYQAFLEAHIRNPELLDVLLDELRTEDPLLELLSAHRVEFSRRSRLGGIYSPDRSVQVVVALLWAGCPTSELASTLTEYFQLRGDHETAQDAIERARQTLDRVNPEALRYLDWSAE